MFDKPGAYKTLGERIRNDWCLLIARTPTLRGIRYDSIHSRPVWRDTMTMPKRNQTTLVSASGAKVKDYQGLLRDIKSRIHAAQVRASLSVNRELIQLYWDVGEMIVNRQRTEGWGKSIVDKLATDLQKNFPGIEGFSPRNMWRMRAFYVAWVRDKPQPTGAKRGRLRSARVPPREREFLPRAVAEIPWGHNIVLLEKLKNSAERIWYARQTSANGWSRSMLDH